MNQEKRPITLEDIIRLKRAERPPAEFWASFDRELRAKQLAALVEKRPWWRSIPTMLGGLTRSKYHLPLGATAVLAITFLVTRDHESAVVLHSSATPAKVAVADVTQVNEGSVSAPAAKVEHVAVSEVAPVAVAALDEAGSPSAVASVALNAAENSAPDEIEVAMPVRQQLDTPSSRFIAENLKAAQAAEPAIARSLLSRGQGFENRGLTAKVAMIEPLARMKAPSNATFAKINSALMNASFKVDNSAVTSERAASRLSEEQLYDHVSRFRANGGNHGLGLDTRL